MGFISRLTVMLLMAWLLVVSRQHGVYASGDMQYARIYHTATLLSNGSVIVIGGNQSLIAEIFDPTSNTWHPTAPMSFPRSGHTATLLLNGKLLITGGVANGLSTSSVEIYDAITNQWVIAANMYNARTGHTATLLSNGNVLVSGGSDSSLRAEIYDPIANVWSLTGSMARTRMDHTATLLDDGRVLVVGGGGSTDTPYGGTEQVEMYNPTTDTWNIAASLSFGRRFHTANKLSNGTVIVIGGTYDRLTGAPLEIYFPEQNIWVELERPRELVKHSTTVLSDGSVLICGGGTTVYGEYSNSAVNAIFDTKTGVLLPARSLTLPRRNHTETLLNDGTVLLTGGMAGESRVAVSSTERYDPRDAVLDNAQYLPMIK
jgi:N-acetylneuraminic acid mutarotase